MLSAKHRIHCPQFLVVFLLGILLHLPTYSLGADGFLQAEVRYLSKLMEQYGKHTLVDRILKLRNGKITVEIDGAFKDATGRPQYNYITPKSLLKDIQAAGLSVAQFGKVLLESVREKQRQARIEAKKRQEAELEAQAELAARDEKLRRRDARRRAFLQKYGEEGTNGGGPESSTYRVSKNSKVSSDPRWAVLKAGQIAAISEEYLDEAYGYIADDDVQSLQVLLEAGVVFVIEQGVKVHVLDSKVWRGRVKIKVEGTNVELWTAIASIEKG